MEGGIILQEGGIVVLEGGIIVLEGGIVVLEGDSFVCFTYGGINLPRERKKWKISNELSHL